MAINTKQLLKMKQNGDKITCLTAYDASFAQLFDQLGIEVLLVGDSLGMAVQGHANTLLVTIDDMCYHTKAVAAKTNNAYLMSDMPYQSYDEPQMALKNARKLVDAGAQMLKIEGFKPDIVNILVKHNITVCVHLGLQPQSVLNLGGFKVQGKDYLAAETIFNHALQLEQHGISALLLECVPAALAKRISKTLTIPTIGIGAGADCDGQILVCYDALGINVEKPYKFVKNFLTNGRSIKEAVSDFIAEVKQGTFPSENHSF